MTCGDILPIKKSYQNCRGILRNWFDVDIVIWLSVMGVNMRVIGRRQGAGAIHIHLAHWIDDVLVVDVFSNTTSVRR